jgi:hypothetical protein
MYLQDSGAAFRAIAANLQPRYRNSEGALLLHFPLELGEQDTLKLRYLATAYASHMQVFAASASLVKMPFAFHMHEIEFIYETLALQESQCAVHGNAVHPVIESLRLAQNLCCIQMAIGRLDDADDNPPLIRDADSARR